MTKRTTNGTTEAVEKIEAPKPAEIEVETPTVEPVKAPEAPKAEKVQTDVREKLAKKSVVEDAFVPSNPVELQKAAKEIAEEKGFELNRGTSVGARLLARAQKRV